MSVAQGSRLGRRTCISVQPAIAATHQAIGRSQDTPDNRQTTARLYNGDATKTQRDYPTNWFRFSDLTILRRQRGNAHAATFGFTDVDSAIATDVIYVTGEVNMYVRALHNTHAPDPMTFSPRR